MKSLNSNNGTVLACFSPLVMIITFAIEILFAVYTLYKHRGKLWGKVIAVVFVSLALFQLSEYQVCGGVDELFWAKIGFISITLLPPLGITLTHLVTGRKLDSKFHLFSWLLAIFFIGSFIFSPLNQDVPVCNGNYVIFDYNYLFNNGMFYGLYYYGLLFVAMIQCYIWSKRAKPIVNKLLTWQILGYSVFIIPTVTVNLLDPSTITAIPSIMCGFALIWAFILMFAMIPKLEKLKLR